MTVTAKKTTQKVPSEHELAEVYYDNADMKRMLKVCDKTLYRYRKQNFLKYCLIGRKYYYPKKYFKQSMKIKNLA